ncbi:MAG: hypothetical protein LBV73_18140, partial [Paraburkholderia sp.]|nr:hypothetical protein [Paraburkholderia sp.]
MKTNRRPGLLEAPLEQPLEQPLEPALEPAPCLPLRRTAGRLLPLALAVSVTFLASGCMVGPDYHRPQVDVPAQWKE